MNQGYRAAPAPEASPSTAALPAADFGSNEAQPLPESAAVDTPLLAAAGMPVDPGASTNAAPSHPGIPGSKREAVARNKAFTQKVRGVIAMAVGQEIDPGEDDASKMALLRNSAEFFTTGRIPLRVLTPTHDSDQRVSAPGNLAYFDGRLTYDQDGADYTDGSAAGIVEAFPEWGHFDPSANEMVVVDPSGTRDEHSIIGTLIHETQHAVDSGPDDAWEREGPTAHGKYDAEPWVWEYFRTEYRARIADPSNKFGDPSKKQPRKSTLTATRDPSDPEVGPGKRFALQQTSDITLENEQQQKIFDHLLQRQGIARWFDYQTGQWLEINGYFAHFAVLDPTFRAFVEGYGETEAPSGGNLVNSVRIATLADHLAQGAVGIVLRDDALALDDIDRHFLRDTATSKPFWELAAEKLLPGRATVYATLQSIILKDRGPDPGAATYTVVAGDTLGRIAERVLGDRARWRDLVRVNPGIDPDHLEPGDELVLP